MFELSETERKKMADDFAAALIPELIASNIAALKSFAAAANKAADTIDPQPDVIVE